MRRHAGILDHAVGKTHAARTRAPRLEAGVRESLDDVSPRGPVQIEKTKKKRDTRARIRKPFQVTRELRILGHQVSIRRIFSTWTMGEKIGESDCDRGEILILAGLESSVDEATVLHEAIHVISDHLSLDVSEAQVSGLAQGLFAMLKDNPEFLR